MKQKLIRRLIWISALSVILLGISILSLSIGSSEISFKRIISLIFEGKGTPEYSIIFDIRLPRIILGFAVGGERQLVSIARALSQEPELLLLDEPTAHLDITYQIGILDLIRRLNKGFGLTVIMVLHDLNLAGQYCDRLILLNQGRVHGIGTPKEILTYQVIEEVYKTVVIVEKNPISSKPYIFLVSEEDKDGSKRL